jgi:hypothetical protein
MVPFQPIIEDGHRFRDAGGAGGPAEEAPPVFQTLRSSSLDRLIETMDKEIVEPA